MVKYLKQCLNNFSQDRFTVAKQKTDVIIAIVKRNAREQT